MLNVGVLSGMLELDDRLSPALLTAAGNADVMERKLDKLGTKVSGFGSDLLPMSAALLGAGGAALVASANFDSSMTRLVSTAGVAQEEIAGVRQHILDLAPAIGIGPQALADAMMKVSSTVSNTSDALAILDVAALGTKAGFGATVDIAGALTSVINSYGAANISAARAGDILAMAIKAGGAEANELAPTLANVVPFAKQMGVSFEEVSANIATMTKLGVPTAEAVTSLTSIFSALSKETNQGKEALGRMNLSYDELRKQIREKGLAATLTDLKERFGDNTSALVDVFGRIEAVKNIMGTAGSQAETYASVLDDIKHSSDGATGSLQDMADAMDGTTVQTWKEFTATLGVLAIKIGDELAPSMEDLTKNGVSVVNWGISAVKMFSELPEWVQTTTIGFVGLLAVAGPGFMALGSTIKGVGASYGLLKMGIEGVMGSSVLFQARFFLLQASVEGVGAAVATAGASFGSFLIAIAPVAIAIASLTAVVTAGWQAWKLYSENQARASDASKQLTVDDFNLARINEALGTSYTNLNDAVKAANERIPEMRENTIAATEANDRAAEAAARTAAAQAQLTEEIQKLADQFSGAGVLKDAQQYERVLTMIGGATKLTKGENDKFADTFDAVIEKYKLLGPVGAEVVEHFTRLRVTLAATTDELKALDELKEAMQKLRDFSHDSAERMAADNAKVYEAQVEMMERASKRMLDNVVKAHEARVNVVAIEQRMEFDAAEFAIEQAERTGASRFQLVEMEKQLSLDKLNAAVNAEQLEFEEKTRWLDLTNVTDKIYYDALVAERNAHVEQMVQDWERGQEAMLLTTHEAVTELINQFVSLGRMIGGVFGDITAAVSNLDGSFRAATAGLDDLKGGFKALSSGNILVGLSGVASGVGGILQAANLAIKAGKALAKAFGFGPSAEELEGRSTAAQFREDLISALTPAQKMEAQLAAMNGASLTWAQSTIAVRDAMMNLGYSQQEALAWGEKLWQAEKGGADEVNRAIAELSAMLTQGYVPAGQEAATIAALGWDETLRLILASKQGVDDTATALTGTFKAAIVSTAGDAKVKLIDLNAQMNLLRDNISKPINIRIGYTFDTNGMSMSEVEAHNAKAEREARESAVLTDVEALEMINRFLSTNSDGQGTPDYHRLQSALGFTPERLHELGIPGYDRGGIAWEPQLATVAESGPELITPLEPINYIMRQLQEMRSEGRGPRTVVIPISVGGRMLEEIVVDISQQAHNERRIVTRTDSQRTRY